MIDYSKKSDFEINKLVANATDTKVEETYQFVNGGEDIADHFVGVVLMRRITNNRKHWKVYDPCNNPSDAWPIIYQNKISVNHLAGEGVWCAHFEVLMPHFCQRWDIDPEYYHDDINPLRAAMIVFLMMREEKIG